jgi:hypothetical protein
MQGEGGGERERELHWKDRRRREDSIGEEMKNLSYACVMWREDSSEFFIIEDGGAFWNW